YHVEGMITTRQVRERTDPEGDPRISPGSEIDHGPIAVQSDHPVPVSAGRRRDGAGPGPDVEQSSSASAGAGQPEHLVHGASTEPGERPQIGISGVLPGADHDQVGPGVEPSINRIRSGSPAASASTRPDRSATPNQAS